MIDDHDLSFDVFEAAHQQSAHDSSLISTLDKYSDQATIIRFDFHLFRSPFRGQYDFRLDLERGEATKDYKLYTDDTGRRVIFVNRDRPFIMRALFRLPLTPLNLYIRIVPLYVAHARRDEVVCRCANHAHQVVTSGSVASVQTRGETEMETSEEVRSFVTVQSPLTDYCRLEGHLTVLVPLDRKQLALGVGSSPDHHRTSNKLHRLAERGSKREELKQEMSTPYLLPSSHPPESQLTSPPSSSYPMGVAAENLICRIGCYTSCLGGQTRGAVELVVRLEEVPSDPLKPPVVLGVDRVGVHCSSTPARDIRLYGENAGPAAVPSKASTIINDPNASVESTGPGSSRRPARRGLSEPSTTSRSKRRLALVSRKTSPATERGNTERNSPTETEEAISSADSVAGLAFIDVPSAEEGSGPKQRFYLVATKSKERAAQLRLMDDASAAFDGTRMSSSKFMAYRRQCLLAQCIASEAYSTSAENCESF